MHHHKNAAEMELTNRARFITDILVDELTRLNSNLELDLYKTFQTVLMVENIVIKVGKADGIDIVENWQCAVIPDLMQNIIYTHVNYLIIYLRSTKMLVI